MVELLKSFWDQMAGSFGLILPVAFKLGGRLTFVSILGKASQ